MLSSHLLDEVEKTCDHVAIVDGGTIVAQGSIAELRGDGHVVFVEADDLRRARRVLTASPAVERVVDDGTSPRSLGPRRGRRARPQPPPRRGRRRRPPARPAARLARAALPRDHDPIGERSMTALALPAPRLVGADLLKLRRNRSLAAVTAVLTVGAVAITVAIMELLHVANPAKHGPAGGIANLGHVAFLIAALGTARRRSSARGRRGRSRTPACTATSSSPGARASRSTCRASPRARCSCCRSSRPRTRSKRYRRSSSPARTRCRTRACSSSPDCGRCSRWRSSTSSRVGDRGAPRLALVRDRRRARLPARDHADRRVDLGARDRPRAHARRRACSRSPRRRSATPPGRGRRSRCRPAPSPRCSSSGRAA